MTQIRLGILCGLVRDYSVCKCPQNAFGQNYFNLKGRQVCTVSTKIYYKRDDFDFDIVNFPFLDGDVPRRNSYGVYISQLIRFGRASSNLNDFNYRNKALTAKLLRQGYRYFKLRKAFSKFYRRHSALLEKYSVSLKTLLQQGISDQNVSVQIYKKI